MPRHVDPIERRREITSAAVRILARSGPRNLTLKSLGEELGGSITLVTHFFANREDLFSAVVDDLIAAYDAELADLEEGAGPEERLRILLHWMLPLDAEDREQEAGRIALITHRSEHDSIEQFFAKMERQMRSMLRQHLADLDLGVDLDVATAFLRSSVNGIVLSAVEHPELWPPDAQRQAIELALQAVMREVQAPRPRTHARSRSAATVASRS
jgi:AcrR family transcriptional regulator